MTRLQLLTIGVGACVALNGAFWAAAPGAARRLWLAFPRQRAAAWVLSGLAFAWGLWLLAGTPMGQFERFRRPLVLLVAVAWVLMNTLNNELLAPRALGGLLILLPAPILAEARWHPSAWRYVMIVAAYVMVLKGVTLILSPYLLRRAILAVAGDDGRARAWGAAGVAVGALMLALGLAVY